MELPPLMSPEADNLQFSPDLNFGDEVEVTDQPSNVEVEFESLPIEEMERRLDVGQPVQNDVVAYGLYCIYARAKGFSVRKSKIKHFSDGSGIKVRDFICSCEGNKDQKRSRLNVPASVRPTMRCQCKARIRISRSQGQNWRVTTFKKDHNHDMYPPDQTHLLRTSRQTKSDMDRCFEAMVKFGIPVSKAHEFLQTVSHERENSVPIQQNVCGPLTNRSRTEDGDVAQLLQHFISLSNKEPYFYWNVQLDVNNKVTNLFFRDYRCNVDYEYFGDVLSVATSYRTNKYNMICCPFVGINNHLQNVMFGFAFMSDETENSFKWLFRSFLESVGGKQPETIFTDQCEAVMNATEAVFPNSHHRLCHWHINQNAHSHFDSLNNDLSFKKLWHECMIGCESEEEFEHKWKQIMDNYNIEDRNWFNLMYSLRHKWANAFSCHKFSAGLNATLKSKDINAGLKRKFGGATSSLYDCVLGFERVQKSWRDEEKEKDTRSHHGKLPVGQNPWLIQASEVYTMEIFSLFQNEVHQSIDFSITEQQEVPGTSLTWFTMKPRGGSLQIITVQFDRQTLSVNCSCHKFETFGILCSHVLKVFDRVNVEYIPKKYIKRRWTKTVRNRVCDGRSVSGSGTNGASDVVFVREIMREMYELATRAQYHEETRSFLTEALESAKLKLNAWFENASLDDFGAADDSDVDEDNL